MTSLTNLPADQIIFILSQLSWQDIDNLCKTNRSICQHPRVKEFINKRLDNLVNPLITINDTSYGYDDTVYKIVEFKSYDPNVRFLFTIVLTYPQVRRPQPIYILTEILTVRLAPKMILSRLQSPDDRVINPIKIKKSIEVNNVEQLQSIIKYLLLNGFIDEDYTQITHRDYVEIIRGSHGGKNRVDNLLSNLIYNDYLRAFGSYLS